MVLVNRAIDRGKHTLDIELPKLKTAFSSTGQLRPVNAQKLSYTTMSQTSNSYKALSACTMQIQPQPIVDQLNNLSPVSIQLASGSEQEPLWDHLVRTHHYLSYQKLIGHRLKYIAFIEKQPVAALSWSAPALKLAARDQFIGWSDAQRKRHLNQLASNSRFLILPWIKVSNLASHVLSLNIAQLKMDWQQHFNHQLLVLETFVDSRYFNGTSYKAANWIHIGDTYGSSKLGKGYVYHGKAKEIYLYIVDPKFRSIIGCRQKAPCLFHRPPPTQIKVEALTMLLEHCQWHPHLVADLNLDESDVKAMAQELIQFHQQFHGHYGRTEHHRLGLAYLSGLMSNAQAKSVEPIALELLDKSSVRSLQMFMKNYCWDHHGMQRAHQSMLAPMIGRPDGMLTVDSCEFPKKGKESVGVARQYCGPLGKVENCQSGVFVGYSSNKGYGLIDCQLYMPESWFVKEQQQRRTANLVPEDLVFKTKLQIAAELIEQVKATGDFPARWVGCDATFGSDVEFLNSLTPDLCYFADIRSDAQVFTKKPKIGLPPYKGRGRRPTKLKVLKGQPKAKSVSEIARSKRLCWKPIIVAEGAKGPIVAKVARIQVYLARDGLPVGNRQWLFLRKNADGQIKYAISNAPKQVSLAELIRASIMRWPIEQCFQEGKSQLGMDCYEHRSWPAWHRHMIYVFLALHFLLRLRLKFKKNSIVDAAAGSQTACCSASNEIAQFKRNNANHRIPLKAQSKGL
jgi:SRSO17 transposase